MSVTLSKAVNRRPTIADAARFDNAEQFILQLDRQYRVASQCSAAENRLSSFELC
jgi:hypothetical protein